VSDGQQFRYFVSGARESETGYLTLSESEIARYKASHGGADPAWDIIHPNYLQRTSFRGNFGSRVLSSADVTINTGVIFQVSQVPTSTIYSNGAWGTGYNDALEGWYTSRPAEVFPTRAKENVTRSTNSLAGNWTPNSWLVARGTVGADFTNNYMDNLQRRGDASPSATGSRQNIRTGINLFTADFGSTASFVLPNGFTSKSTLGVQYNRRAQYTTTATGSNLPPGSSTVTGAGTISSSESTVQSVIAGGYGEEVVSYKERFFLTLAARADGGSSFGRNFHTAVYPKAGLSWLISNEPWYRDFLGLTSARYRLAYGSSGVQPSSTARLPLVSLTTVFTNGTTTNGAQVSSIGNLDLRPERQREFETGLDLEFLGGRIRTEQTYYNRLSKDALVSRPFPGSLGISARQENLGSVSNLGWEGLLTGRVLDRKEVSFDLTVVASVNRNKLVWLDPSVIVPTGQFTPGQFIRFVQGYPLYSQWDLPILGFKDANNDGIIADNEFTLGDTVVYLGNPNPTELLTVTPQFTLLKGRLTLSSLFEHKGGWIQTNFSELNKCYGTLSNSCRALNDPTAPLEMQARMMAIKRPQTPYTPEIQSGTFTRWREASASYELGNRLAARVGAQSARVTLSARNLRIWTKYDGLDPEVTSSPSLSGGAWDLGYDNPVSPQSHYWILKMNLRF
jgi:hypothetical protein